LRDLDLQDSKIGDAGARALAGARGMPRLRRLGLWGCRIGPDGAMALAASPYLDGLDLLDLSINPLKPTSREARAACAALRQRFGDRVRL